VSEEVNRKCRSRNTKVYNFQRLYTDTDWHSAQRHRQTDRQSDHIIIPRANRAVRSVKEKWHGVTRAGVLKMTLQNLNWWTRQCRCQTLQV